MYLMPGLLKFDDDCLILLRRSLLSVAPEEGCAILLGEKKISKDYNDETLWRVRVVWPCRNVWEPKISNLIEGYKDKGEEPEQKLSKHNRFALDPKEQLKAQKWARSHDLLILGAAHSHPRGKAIPSLTDYKYAFSSKLMIIVSGSGELGAWWIGKNKKCHRVKVSNLVTS